MNRQSSERTKIINLINSTIETFIAELKYNELEKAIKNRDITVKEIVFKFQQELESKLK